MRLITCLGPDAAQAVPKLIEMHETKPWDAGQMNALAAIGPAASAAVPALEEYARKEDPGPDQAASYYALFCIRGEVGDLRAMVRLLKDTQVNAQTKDQVVKFLNQLGARAEPVADEVRQMVKSGEFPDREAALQSFLEKVKKGEMPANRSEF